MDQLVEHGQSVIEKGSKSFAAAARIFDPQTRAGAYMLYAWCRHCDDQTDDQELGFEGSHLEPA
ncbi:MAG: squalene/phytoene synthase family protein, partial [Thermoanaerobaculales bacterium]|nr:squalene/phytoene synthase family protein [Thermoanaerobaculales bacterium]